MEKVAEAVKTGKKSGGNFHQGIDGPLGDAHERRHMMIAKGIGEDVQEAEANSRKGGYISASVWLEFRAQGDPTRIHANYSISEGDAVGSRSTKAKRNGVR